MVDVINSMKMFFTSFLLIYFGMLHIPKQDKGSAAFVIGLRRRHSTYFYILR